MAGGIAGIDADGKCRPRGRRQRRGATCSGHAASSWSPDPATTAAMASLPPALLAERGYRVRVLAGRRPRPAQGRCGAGGATLAGTIRAGCAGRAVACRRRHRCAVRGGSRPAGRRRRTRHDRGHERCIVRPCGRSAERHQRHHRGGDGRGGRGDGNGDVLPAQDRPCAAARPAALRAPSRRRHRYSRARPRIGSSRGRGSTLRACGPRSFPVPRVDGHKYARGHAVVVSGGLASTGAARLAARGALRGGAGLVTIASPREALAVNAAANLAVMVRPVDGAAELAELPERSPPQRRRAGAGRRGGIGRCANWSWPHWRAERAVVLDADALTSFADEPQALLAAMRNRPQATIMTPHEGEFVRLFKAVAGEARSKLEKARIGRRRSRGRRPAQGAGHRRCRARRARRRSRTTRRLGLRPPDRATCLRVLWPAASPKACRGSKRRRLRCGCMARRAPRQVRG